VVNLDCYFLQNGRIVKIKLINTNEVIEVVKRTRSGSSTGNNEAMPANQLFGWRRPEYNFGPETLDMVQSGVSIGLKARNKVFEKILQEFDDFLEIWDDEDLLYDARDLNSIFTSKLECLKTPPYDPRPVGNGHVTKFYKDKYWKIVDELFTMVWFGLCTVNRVLAGKLCSSSCGMCSMSKDLIRMVQGFEVPRSQIRGWNEPCDGLEWIFKKLRKIYGLIVSFILNREDGPVELKKEMEN
jgi:hypothetical protein